MSKDSGGEVTYEIVADDSQLESDLNEAGKKVEKSAKKTATIIAVIHLPRLQGYRWFRFLKTISKWIVFKFFILNAGCQMKIK